MASEDEILFKVIGVVACLFGVIKLKLNKRPKVVKWKEPSRLTKLLKDAGWKVQLYKTSSEREKALEDADFFEITRLNAHTKKHNLRFVRTNSWRSSYAHGAPLLPFVSRTSSKAAAQFRFGMFRKKYPEIFDFMCEGYVVPLQFGDFERAYEVRESKVWIVKPSHDCQGRNIKVISNPEEAKRSIYKIFIPNLMKKTRPDHSVIEHYISNPYTIDGRKFHLRIFSCLTNPSQPEVHVYSNGIMRRTVNKFSMDDFSDLTTHITNTGYQFKDMVGSDKISDFALSEQDTLKELTWLIRPQTENYFKTNGINFEKIFKRIKEVIFYAHCMMYDWNGSKNERSDAYAFWGSDIIIDEDLRVWLIEINYKPGMANSVDFPCDIYDLYDRMLKQLLFSHLKMYHEGAIKLPDIPGEWDFVGKLDAMLSVENFPSSKPA